MAKQLNIQMNINANTQSAQAELKKLQQTLDQVISGSAKSSGSMKITKEITEATQAAAKLKVALNSAVNPQTGNLDLSKFAQQLDKSKMSLQQYSNQLINLGPTGEKAFMQMAQAIGKAEIPLRKSGSLLSDLWTTMKNTARWQLSSSALHAFMGAIQGAYGYAQDLNESLNNIRIVTGQTTEQMARFAEQANQAAKALSTTTTAYTDAALIYYQQGLSDSQVKERTDVTIKLANVSRQSAEEVSSQMTAVWNNFVDGSKSLEYYADVITALGAATASSSDEIAQGLQKFASVADTVGLSYEKATAALATVVAETRQSADVVGTAFKTMFARFQGLQLGETLEDGVTLNKYSEALQKVGVSILDANGNLKNMDSILDDTYQRWNQIGDAQKVALAETVAGTRQYAQFMALMDNYDKVLSNENLAESSEGTLQQQADIYAESWEAASKRVRAAAEGIYQDLLNDEFFIGFNNTLAGLLENVDKFIDKIGGIPGVLSLLGTVATSVFSKQISASIDNAVHNLAVFSGVAEKQAKQMQQEMTNVIMAQAHPGEIGNVQQAENTLMVESIKLAQDLSDKRAQLSSEDYEYLQLLMQITEQYGQQAVAAAKASEAADQKQAHAREDFTNKWVDQAVRDQQPQGVKNTIDAVTNARNSANDVLKTIEGIIVKAKAGQAAIDAINNALRGEGIDQSTYEQVAANFTRMANAGVKMKNAKGELNTLGKLNQALQNHEAATQRVNKAQEELNQLQKQGVTSGQDFEDATKELNSATQAQTKAQGELKKATEEADHHLKSADNARVRAEAHARSAGATTREETAAVREFIKAVEDSVDKENESLMAQDNYAKQAAETKAAIQEATSATIHTFGQGVVTAFRGVSQLSMGITTLKSAFDTINNTDMSFGEKLLSVTTSLGMAIPMLITGFSSLKTAHKMFNTDLKNSIKNLGLTLAGLTAEEAAQKTATGTTLAKVIADELSAKANDKQTATIWKKVAAYIAEKIAAGEVYIVILLVVAAIAALVAIAAGAILAIQALSDAYNADAIAAKQAAEAAKELTEAAQEANNRLKDIQDTVNNYKSAIDKLSQCTRGTQEWNEALTEVHAQIDALLQKYPELLENASLFNDDGTLNIKVLDQFEQQAKVAAEAANAAALSGQAAQAAADFKSNKTDAKRTYNPRFQVVDDHPGYTNGEYHTVESDLRKLLDTYKTNGSEVLELKDVYDALGSEMGKNAIITEEYAKTLQGLARDSIAAQNAAENVAKVTVDKWAEATGTELSLAQKVLMNQAYNEAYETFSKDVAEASDQNAKADYKDNSKLGSAFDDTSFAGMSVTEAFNAARGTSYDLAQNGVRGTNNNRSYVFLENGQEKEYKLEEMKQTIAAAAALEGMGKSADEASKILNGLSTEGQQFVAGIANSEQEDGSFDTTKFLQNFTPEQLKAITEEGGIDVNANEISDNVLQMFGLNDRAQFDKLAEHFEMTGQELMQALLDGATNAADSLTDKDKKQLSHIDTSGMTVAEQKEFTSNKQNVYDQFRTQNLIAGDLIPLIDMQNKDNVEGLNNFYAALSGVNLTAEDATEQVKGLVDKFGITGEGVNNLISRVDALDKQFNVSSQSINEQAASLKSVVNDLNTGDTVSAEDIATLEKAGIDTSDYFTQMADGSYMLTTAAEEFKGLVESITLEALKEQIQDFNRAKEEAATGKWFDKYLTDTGVVSGSYISNSGESGYMDESADDLGRARLNYMSQFEPDSFAFNEEQKLLLENYKVNPELELTSQQLQQIADMIDIVNQKQADLQSQLFTTATSLTELDAIAKDLGTYDYNAYADGLINLASQYDNCADEIEEFQIALLTGSEAAIKAAEDNLRAATLIGEAAEKYDLEAEVLEAQADRLAKAYGVSAEAAAKLAVKNQRMNKGVSSLVDNWKDWKKQLSATDHLTEDYAEAVVDCTAAIADLVGASSDLELPDEFFNTKNMALLEKAAQGDIAAINALGAEVGWFIADALEFNEAFASLAAELESFNGFDLSHIDLSKALNAAQFDADKNLVLSGIADIKNGLMAEGQSMSDEWIAALNRMAITTGMSVESMNGLLGSIGVQAKVETTYVKQPMEVPTYTEKVEGLSYKRIDAPRYDENGALIGSGYEMVPEYTKATVPGEPIKTEGWVAVAQISTEDNPLTLDIESSVAGGGGPSGAATYSPSRGSVAPSAKKGSGKGGGGGGKGKEEKAPTRKAASHTHEVHRYSNEENQLKGLADIYDRIATAKDHAFGTDRIRLMDKELKYLGKLKQASSDYLKTIVGEGNVDKIIKAAYEGEDIGKMIASGAIGGTVGADFASLSSGKDASGKGVEYTVKDAAGNEDTMKADYSLAELNSITGKNFGIQLDSFGNIANKDQLLTDIDNALNAEAEQYSQYAEPTADQENQHNKTVAYLESFKERIEQYGETVPLALEQVNTYLGYIYDMQQINADKIAHRLEVQNELTEHALSQITNATKLLGKKAYRDTEAMASWFSLNTTQRHDAQKDRALKAYKKADEAKNLWDLWNQNPLDEKGINSEQAMSILDTSKDQLQTAFDDIFDEISEVEAFFGDTLDDWNERIEKVTASMEANADTLEHLQNVLSLLGKETDYEAIGTILQGQLSVAEDNYAAAKEKAESSERSYQDALAHYQTLSGENAKWYKETVLDPLEAQWHDDVAAKEAALENVLEKVNAWFENQINKIYQESEDRLTGKWGSFDALDAAMERQHNLAEEYLTKTNQLYETNTLLRKLSQDIDKTDSSIAKRKLKAFSDEINAMKEQNQLSKAELDIAKARYDLLLAEIALEEAQNAKSTVRLQRDNEGNYGYVYTADQEKINDAEQAFADKENALYNLVLEQSQDYTEKIIQHTRERNEALAELDRQWQAGEITSLEEYNTLRQDIIDKYNAIIQTDYDNYYRAIGWLNQVGAEGQTEAWTDSFKDILYSQDEYSKEILSETDNITKQTDTMISWLNDQRDRYTEDAKLGNEELKKTVDNITTANKALRDSLTGENGLIKGMEKATTAAAGLTAEFAKQYEELKRDAEHYAILIGRINDYYELIANPPGEDENQSTSTMQTGTGDSGDGTPPAESTPSNGYGDYITFRGNSNNRTFYTASGNYHLEGTHRNGYAGSDPEAIEIQKAWDAYYVAHGGYGDSVDWSTNTINMKVLGFDTGGYTGEWGDNGKLAFLHQKELVLNASDTQNLLDAVALIREINSAIDLRAAAGYMGNMLQSPGYSAQAQVIEQEVTIHAEFPNATNHTEIEQAFDNLINRASQYANRG